MAMNWTRDNCWELLKALSPTVAARVGNRVHSGINYAGCSPARIADAMFQSDRREPTRNEIVRAILIEVFGSLEKAQYEDKKS